MEGLLKRTDEDLKLNMCNDFYYFFKLNLVLNHVTTNSTGQHGQFQVFTLFISNVTHQSTDRAFYFFSI